LIFYSKLVKFRNGSHRSSQCGEGVPDNVVVCKSHICWTFMNNVDSWGKLDTHVWEKLLGCRS
jgi:hypothetical protein